MSTGGGSAVTRVVLIGLSSKGAGGITSRGASGIIFRSFFVLFLLTSGVISIFGG